MDTIGLTLSMDLYKYSAMLAKAYRMTQPEESVLTLDELSEYLKVSKSSLYKLVQAGRIPDNKALLTSDPNAAVTVTVEINADLRLLFENPYDRLVAASSHFMRANYASLFQSPFEQDFSAACACLEAAFDIPRGGYVDGLIAKLTEKYGDPSGFSAWIRGLAENDPYSIMAHL